LIKETIKWCFYCLADIKTNYFAFGRSTVSLLREACMEMEEARSKLLRVGIIGTGWGVKVQVPAFRKAGWEVTALSGRDEAKVP
jgi:hypothetical protein